MATHRGRKSAAEKEALAALRAARKRPAPPKHLTTTQKKIWRRTCSELPADWFRPETLDLLEDYCGWVEMNQQLLGRMPAADAPIDEVERYIRNREKVTSRVVQLATKMRITQQSTYDRERVKETTDVDDPWQRA